MKFCKKCNVQKPFTDFSKQPECRDGHLNTCKTCIRMNSAAYYQKHKDKVTQRQREYYVKNRDKKLKQHKRYNESRKEKLSAYQKEYYQKNKQKITANENKRLQEDINFRLSKNIRRRIYSAIKNGFKNSSAIKELGCSIEEFKNYIEHKFQVGMSWENYGMYGWHLDHIKPLSYFDLTDEQQFREACHYSNYQPLWAIDNLKKSDKI